MLGYFVAHRFLAFDAIRLFQRGDVEPAFGLLSLRDNAAAIADESVDEGDVRAGGFAFDVVGLRDIARHEDVSLDSGRRGVRRHGSGGVARRGNRRLLHAELGAHRYSAGKAASFERARRVQAFIFDPKIAGADAFAETARTDKRCPAFAHAHDMAFVVEREGRAHSATCRMRSKPPSRAAIPRGRDRRS